MKKIIKILLIILLLVTVIYFGIYLIQNYSLKRSFSIETNTVLDHDTKLIRCNNNILNPEFAFTFETGEGGIIGFHSLENLFYATKKKWDDGDIGTASIKNTTFEELLKMVKEDCSRFQRSGSVSENPDETRWVYSPAPTKEEKGKWKLDRIKEIKTDIIYLSEEKKQELSDDYGYNPDFTDDELYDWWESTDFENFDPEG